MKRVTHCVGSLDFSGWDPTEVAKLMLGLKADEYEFDYPYATLPISWAYGKSPSDGIGGPPVEDPLTIDIQLPSAGDEDFTLRTNLKEIVQRCLSDPRWRRKIS